MAPIKEVTFERTFDAPLEKVWQAWTDPAMIKQWWGPDNVTIPECEVDLRVGGRIYIVMEAGEGMGQYKGTRWPMEGKLTVVEPHAKISYDVNAWVEGHNENGESNIDQTTEVIFTEESGKTKMNLKATIHKTGPAAGMAVEGMQMGFTQQLDKLTAFLARA